ncbi:hypothetical protein [Aneurinibacillus aneurinilyticus]|jgi:hypothetical protein|uniref:FeS cluster biogenesis domain-containing protein n=2 Tax=Aneurinibacillus aneurinilyticus TaxID=1391 RepID=A0A848D0Q7_ANEAE|nr:hypothetical protein [Aneurinibacillus aneurinilyticus]ERI07537.1 hypothetical protein HMPREF0083_04384 [Aneurinibacillus aneurinilyticus ATCC 12856]MCI1692551.1 hypothetical protein [Aneurinibacillus aneurinilyticus]MED0673674.1 hypothetical protein [Aneurinibacillus aneurinilyticus]MED0705189.1 hypothetical protein [Aneurinibacillus aneurinilyticus]MED0725685.1 hypothetical protein [Aneurinibacillus aneurinilyticus]
MLRITPAAHKEAAARLKTPQRLSILGILEGGCGFMMRFSLVQGDIPGSSFDCIEEDGIMYCLDTYITKMYPEAFTLDYVENQGFRLYTDSQYMATHLKILHSVEQV